jgi:ubiquinone/menaquinone biosynthesis C-methylase UbiE
MTANPVPVSRVTRTRKQARATYDRLSRWYDLLAGSSERPFRLRGLEMLAVQPGSRVLEIGAGTGEALLHLAESVHPNGLAAGIDLSPGMLRAAARKLQRHSSHHPYSFVNADGLRLPFPGGRFDALFLSFTLELFDTPEISVVLTECTRVLAPGGRIVIVALSRSGSVNLAVHIYEWFHNHFQQFIDCRPIPAQAFVKSAGLQILQSETRHMWGLPVDIIQAVKP